MVHSRLGARILRNCNVTKSCTVYSVSDIYAFSEPLVSIYCIPVIVSV